jgi:SagB-type dehydrogenase family enzyme
LFLIQKNTGQEFIKRRRIMNRNKLSLTIIIIGFLIVSMGIRNTLAQINWPAYGYGSFNWPGIYNNFLTYRSYPGIGAPWSFWGSSPYPALSPMPPGIWNFSLPQALSPPLPMTWRTPNVPFQVMNLSPPQQPPPLPQQPIFPQERESLIIINLPEPLYDSNTSIEKTLLNRRSVREYKNEALSLEELSQLLWAAQGITAPPFYKTAPSAGALYPLDLYIVAGNIEDLSDGTYKYEPQDHELVLILEGDKRNELYNAALSQSPIKDAPAVIILGGVYSRTTQKYGEKGIRYVHIEVGCVAQNIYLQAVSLNLGTVSIGAFYDEDVKKILNIHDNWEPLVLMPVGRK